MKGAFVRITEFPKREVYPIYYQIGTQLPNTVLDTFFWTLFLEFRLNKSGRYLPHARMSAKAAIGVSNPR